MLFLCLSVLSSTIIVLLFRAFDTYQVRTFPAICVNYIVCVLCAWAVLGEFPVNRDSLTAPWLPYAISLGFLFITGFNLIAFTVQRFNVTVGAVMQKMSLLLTVIYTIGFYNESAGFWKITGIVLALVAIILINIPKKTTTEGLHIRNKWLYLLPLATWLVSAAIEILLFETEQISGQNADLGFIAFLFGTAAVLGNIRLLAGLPSGKIQISMRDVIGGIALGIPNFGSIYFLLKTLGIGWEGSVVFPLNNVSIIALSALLAFLLFKEKLSYLNIAGVLAAIMAIFLISGMG